MKTAFAHLHKFLCYVMAVLMMLITFFTLYQVFCRYVLQDSASWSEELIRYLFIWVSILGAAVGVHERIHMGVDIIVNRVPAPLKKLLFFVAQIGLIMLSCLLIYQGMKFVGKTAKQISPAMGLPMKYVYMAGPVGGVLLIVYILESMFTSLTRKEGE